MAPFILLLVIVCITDFIASNAGVFFSLRKNYVVYNCYIIASFPIYLYAFFRMLLYSNSIKKIFFWLTGLIITGFIIVNLFLIQGIKPFNTNSLVVTQLVNIILSLLVLMELFKDDDFNIMIYEHPYFWINGAILIFGIGTIIALGLQPIILAEHLQINGKYIYGILMQALSTFLYLTFGYAFFLCQKTAKKLS